MYQMGNIDFELFESAIRRLVGGGTGTGNGSSPTLPSTSSLTAAGSLGGVYTLDPSVLLEACSGNGSVGTGLAPNAASSSVYVRRRIFLDVYAVVVICAVGFVGNALTFAVLRRDRQQDGTGPSTNWLLRSLAVIDTVYLVSCLLIQTVKTAHDFIDPFPAAWRPYFPYVEKWSWPLASVAQTITVWTV